MQLTGASPVMHITCMKPDLSFQSRLAAFRVFAQAPLRGRKLADPCTSASAKEPELKKHGLRSWIVINFEDDRRPKKKKGEQESVPGLCAVCEKLLRQGNLVRETGPGPQN